MALGHLIISLQSDWKKDRPEDMAKQFVCDIDGLLRIDLDPDVRAKLLLIQSNVQIATGQKEEAEKSISLLHKICQENREVLDIIIEVLNYQAGKMERPVPNHSNIALMFSVTKGLPGLGKRADTAADWMIDAGAKSDSLYDALIAVNKRLMQF